MDSGMSNPIHHLNRTAGQTSSDGGHNCTVNALSPEPDGGCSLCLCSNHLIDTDSFQESQIYGCLPTGL